MRTTPRTLLGAALLAAGSLQPLSAGAQPPRTDDRRAEADAEFAEAKLLMEAGQTSAACPKFARSQELDPRLGRLLNLAFCHEQEGKVASAWHEYTEATSLAEQRGQAEREDFARARAAAVARELAFVLLELPHDVATAAVDGTALAREVWSTPIPLDPGEHTVLLTAPGKKPRSATVTMSGAPGVRVFAIAPLEHEAHPPPPPAGGAPAALRDGAAPGRVPGYIAAGLAAAGLGLGAGFGIDAMSKRGAAEPHCPGRLCDAQGSALLSEARSSATVSTVAFGAGGASALVALWFLLRPAPSGETRSAWVTPVLEAHAAGMGVRGTW